MRPIRKIIRAYDRRQNEYQQFMTDSRHETKVTQRMQSGGYKRPGSRNPRKARG